MTPEITKSFLYLTQVTHPHRLWGWMGQYFLPKIYAGEWYNGKKEKEEVYIENKKSILLGMPRMRQLRVKKSRCILVVYFTHACFSVVNIALAHCHNHSSTGSGDGI